MTRRIRRGAAALVAFALLWLTGCYAIEESADRTVIRFNAVSRLLMVAIPFGMIAGGLLLCCFRPTRIPGAIVTLGVAGLSGLIVPGMYQDRVVITPTEITQTTGFWFAPKVNSFRYADVRSVSIRTVEKRDHDARLWVVRRKDGTTQEIDPGDLWEFNESLIVTKLRGYGVNFE